ncbi:uncharacterized protein LOC135495667 [Lineus longissimus]|uniref:uncharacterized protein LOC135495667 n=1 Tax=Lineus longissimus TaxID=88925 RepID=UPI002B4D2BFB
MADPGVDTFPPDSPFRFFYNTVTSDDINKAMLTDHDGSKRGKCKIGFLTHFVCEDYHQLVVVGSIPELGEWDPAAGVVAHRLDAGGWWLATVDIPKTNTFVIMWKWIVRSPDGSYVIRWEERSNRILYPQKRHHFIVAPWFEDGLLLQPDCPVTKGAMGGRADRTSRLLHPFSSDSRESTLDRDGDSAKLVGGRRGSLKNRIRGFFKKHRSKDRGGNQDSTQSAPDYSKIGTM